VLAPLKAIKVAAAAGLQWRLALAVKQQQHSNGVAASVASRAAHRGGSQRRGPPRPTCVSLAQLQDLQSAVDTILSWLSAATSDSALHLEHAANRQPDSAEWSTDPGAKSADDVSGDESTLGGMSESGQSGHLRSREHSRDSHGS